MSKRPDEATANADVLRRLACRIEEAQDRVRKMNLRPGHIAPLSGQYTMTGTLNVNYVVDGKSPKFRRQCIAVRGKMLPSGGSGTAGHFWRLTDTTRRKR